MDVFVLLGELGGLARVPFVNLLNDVFDEGMMNIILKADEKASIFFTLKSGERTEGVRKEKGLEPPVPNAP